MAVQSVRRWEKGEEKGWEKSLRDDRQLMIDTSACRDKTTIKDRQSRKLEKKKKRQQSGGEQRMYYLERNRELLLCRGNVETILLIM